MIENLTFDKRDEFHRKPFAESLIDLIKNNPGVFPVAIDGEWGTGKSEFCQKAVALINQVYQDELIATSINAFAEDKFDQPMISLLANFYRTFSNDKDFIKNDSRKRFLNIGGKIAKSALPAAVAAFSPAVGKFIEKAVDGFGQRDPWEDLIENRAKLDSLVEEFAQIIGDVRKNRKLVLFVDELDRCRPDYALHFLEVVKHTLHIDGLMVIFIVNINQLLDVIKVRYGSEKWLAERYLDKFFSVKIRLPTVLNDSGENAQSASESYVRILLEGQRFKKSSLLFADGDNLGCHYCTRLICEMVKYYDATLRDVEKTLDYLNLYETFHPVEDNASWGRKLIITYAVCEYANEWKMYRYFKENQSLGDGTQDLERREKNNDNGRAIPLRHIVYKILFCSGNDDLVRRLCGYEERDSLQKFFITILKKLDSLII